MGVLALAAPRQAPRVVDFHPRLRATLVVTLAGADPLCETLLSNVVAQWYPFTLFLGYGFTW